MYLYTEPELNVTSLYTVRVWSREENYFSLYFGKTAVVLNTTYNNPLGV